MGVRRVRGALFGVLNVLARSGGSKIGSFFGAKFGSLFEGQKSGRFLTLFDTFGRAKIGSLFGGRFWTLKIGSILERPKPRFRRVEISTFWG